jgi:hypothetical protein
MSTKTLSALVRIYQHRDGPRLAEYLNYFRNLGSVDEAIHFACHGREGRIHGHQHRVGSTKLEQARRSLQRHAAVINASESFDELMRRVENYTRSIKRFGILAVYDTSLRLGAHLDLWPGVVYLHAGTKKGCKALGVATSGATVEMGTLPRAMRVLKPYQAEDFLCIFKDHFEGRAGSVNGCLPTGCMEPT